MSELRFNFLNWRPDIEPSSHDGLTVAENVLHDAEGYKPLLKRADASAVVLSTAVSGASIVSTHIRQIGPRLEPNTFNSKIVARLTNATLAALYVSHIQQATGFGLTTTLATFSGGTAMTMTSNGAINVLSVCELNDYVFVCANATGSGGGLLLSANVTGTMQISAPISPSAAGGSDYFSADLAASTVSALVCGAINQFVVIAEVANPTSVRWCAIGNANDWPTPNTDAARAVQAGSQSMPPEWGFVTGIVPGEFYGYVFQERGLTKMTYVGGDVVFAFDRVEGGAGCIAFERFVEADGVIHFESPDGYHALRDGQVADTGFGRVDDSYRPETDAFSSFYPVVKNEAINTVFFSNHGLTYNYKTDQFTAVPALDGYALYSIDDQDAVIGTVVITRTGNDIDAFQGQEGGVAQTAVLETAERDLNQGGRAELIGVRPRVNGGTVTVSAGVRNDLDDAVTYWTGVSNSRTGMSNFRSATNKAEGRYQRVRLSITGGFTTALGADVDVEPSGGV